MRNVALCFSLILMTATSSFGVIHGWKGTVHLLTVPLVVGSGAYASITMLKDAEHAGTKAGAITNLSFITAQAALGATILFTSDDMPPALRVIHRIVGVGVIASGLWLSIEGSLDHGVTDASRYVAYGHTVMATTPLILFTF